MPAADMVSIPQANLTGLPWLNKVTARQASPPGSPTTGARYLISTGSGGWSGHSEVVAEYNGSAWVYFTAVEGMTVWNDGDTRWWTFSGSTWTPRLAVVNTGSAANPNLIGPVIGGNARGTNAIDLQNHQASSSDVASGNYAIAIGGDNEASGSTCVCLGWGNTALTTYNVTVGYNNYINGGNSVAIGANTTVSGGDSVAIGSSVQCAAGGSIAIGNGAYAAYSQSMAFGHNATAYAANAIAFGDDTDAQATGVTAINSYARSGVPHTVNLNGTVINRKDSGEVGAGRTRFQSFSGAVVVLMSEVVNLASGGAEIQLDIPTNGSFYVNDCGLVIVAADGGVNTHPTLSMGVNGDPTKHINAVAISTSGNAGDRWVGSPGKRSPAETNVTGTVAVAGSANSGNLTGRFWWEGMLVENQ